MEAAACRGRRGRRGRHGRRVMNLGSLNSCWRHQQAPAGLNGAWGSKGCAQRRGGTGGVIAAFGVELIQQQAVGMVVHVLVEIMLVAGRISLSLSHTLSRQSHRGSRRRRQ